MKLHGVPFDSLETVENFMACVKNVVPEADCVYVKEPMIGSPYVIVQVHRGMDSFTLIASPGDELKVSGENVWIKPMKEEN